MTKNDVNRRVVMVDLDGVNPKWQKVEPFLIRFEWVLSKLWPGSKWKIEWEKSPSGSGVHLWAVLIPGVWRYLLDEHILLAQCLAGSDIARERANLSRIAAGVKDWNRLFSTKRVGFLDGRKNAKKKK